ncbi:hypothetical protein ABKV19_004244 [Rosa sericea]
MLFCLKLTILPLPSSHNLSMPLVCEINMSFASASLVSKRSDRVCQKKKKKNRTRKAIDVTGLDITQRSK